MSKLEFSDSDFDPVVLPEEDQTCNYCNRRTALMPDKPYCGRCHGMMFRECKRCHKPFHLQRYFEKDELRCNSCFEKLQKERQKRAMKKQRVEADEEDDDVQFMGGPSKPKKKAVQVNKSVPSTSSATPAEPRVGPFGASPTEARVGLFGASFDMKDAKMGYIPIFFK